MDLSELRGAAKQAHTPVHSYDNTNPKALAGLQQMLGGFWLRGGLKLMVLACKFNAGSQSKRVDPTQAVHLCQQYSAGLVALDGGLEDPHQKYASLHSG